MKVLFAMCAAWLLRMAWACHLAGRLEAWAGINYDPDQDDYKVGGTSVDD